VVTWGKIASWTAAAAVTAGSGLAAPHTPAVVRAAARARPLVQYAPVRTGHGMCLDDPGGAGRDGQPVQLWRCLGNREQAWQAEPDGTIRNANGYCLGTGSAANGYAATAAGTPLVMVDCARSYLGSYWTISPSDDQVVNKHAGAAMDNRNDAQRDGNPVQLGAVAAGRPSQDWAVVPSGGGAPLVTPGEPPDLHVDHANMVTSGGQVFVPRGFTLSTLQYARPYLDGARAYSSVLSETKAQVDAIAGAWHGNIVRFQIEQDDLVQREAVGDHGYLSLIRAAVSYAQAKGLAVVLNAQTEPSGERLTLNEPLPTLETLKFWLVLQRYYGNDDSVILDVFNEPRPLKGNTVTQYMALWKDGGLYQGAAYLGHQQLAEMLRANGYATNMLWVEPPGNDGLAGLLPPEGPPASTSASTSAGAARQASAVARVQEQAAVKSTADPAAFLLDGVPDVSYSFHHPTVLGVPRTQANWDAQFGNLVRDDELSVNDGEWATRSQYTGIWAANGDSGPCWSDAPTAVPRYLAYLQQIGVGMAVWTLSDGEPAMGATSASDPGPFTTTATMTGWPGCVNIASVRGPGALIMAWYTQQAG
jgi:ricin-type beta-trefoil lectin protein/cellulase (glycosyl hydrolase family 5)